MAELRGGVVIRDEVLDSITKPCDLLGRKQPHILGALGILSVGMQGGMPAPVEVPEKFWRTELGEEGYTVAIVTCPCSDTPIIEVGCVTKCQCFRYYYFPLDKVLVWNFVAANPELQSES